MSPIEYRLNILTA